MKPEHGGRQPAETNNNSNTKLPYAIRVLEKFAVNVHRCDLLSLHRFSLLFI